jgi:hypothetical protein
MIDTILVLVMKCQFLRDRAFTLRGKKIRRVNHIRNEGTGQVT